MSQFLRHHYVLVLTTILAFAFFCRVYRLSQPQHYVFDEIYHAVTAKLISRNDPRAYEWWHGPIEPQVSAGTVLDWLHPPLAKYTQALAMKIFGENEFGWRISSAIFGVLVIAVTAKLGMELFEDRELAILAALFASLDGLLLVQSRVAMNDIHVTFFILLTAVVYLQFRKKSKTVAQMTTKQLQATKVWPRPRFFLFLTGVCAGLAMGSKWSGVFILGVVWLFELIHFIAVIKQQRISRKELATLALTKSKIHQKKSRFTPPNRPKLTRTQWSIYIGMRVVYLLIIPAVVYILSYTHMFLQGKTLICEGNQPEQGKCYCRDDSSFWVVALSTVVPQKKAYWESLEARGGCTRMVSHFSELHYQILWYQTHLVAHHDYQSRPLDWFLDLRPVWMSVEYEPGTVANIYSQGNPMLFWIGDIAVITSILYLIDELSGRIITHVQEQPLEAAGRPTWASAFSFISSQAVTFPFLFLIVSYFAVWLPWEFSPRIMFFYHYTPAVPFLCLILAYWVIKIKDWDIETRNYVIHLGRIILALVIVLITLNFVLFYPNWIGYPVPVELAQKVYFALPSWK